LFFFSFSKFIVIIKVSNINYTFQLIYFGKICNDCVDAFTDILAALQCDHIPETTPFGNFYERIFLAFIPVGNIFHEQQNQHIIFVLGSIHAATQFIATLPQG